MKAFGSLPSCEKPDGRCRKRKDLEGNKICRTPPFPPSHTHWVMDIETQYPHKDLESLKRLNLAEKYRELYLLCNHLGR